MATNPSSSLPSAEGLRARITALEQDLARTRRIGEAAQAAREAAEATLAGLRAYVQHEDGCDAVKWEGPWRLDEPSGQPCSCGLSQALTEGPQDEKVTDFRQLPDDSILREAAFDAPQEPAPCECPHCAHRLMAIQRCSGCGFIVIPEHEYDAYHDMLDGLKSLAADLSRPQEDQ
jgi:uncharacterized small protein (DUF1192 family)